MRAALSPREAGAGPGWIGSGLLLLVPLVFSAVVYHPITRNYFFVDDFVNLYDIANDDPVTYLLRPHGGHLLLTRNALFYAFDMAFGADASLYFWGVLLTHLVNVALLFLLVRTLTSSPLLACFGATLWGISPLNEETLGWYSVYGQVVACTFALLILCRIARWGMRNEIPPRWVRLLWYVPVLLAITSFGTAIGVAAGLPLLAAVVLPRRGSLLRTPFLPLWIIIPVLYFALPWSFAQWSGEKIPVAYGVVFNWQTWPDSPALLHHLIVYGTTQLLAGVSYGPEQYPDATSAAIGGAVALFVLIGFGLATARTRRWTLALLVLYAGSYATIALARAVFYQQFLAKLSIASRYHYLPTVLLVTLLCALLADLGRRVPFRTVKWGALLVWLGWSAFSHHATPVQIDHHDRDRRAARWVLSTVHRLVERTPPGEDAYLFNHAFEPMGFIVPPTRFPGWAGVFVGLVPDNTVGGRRVRFIERHPRVIEATKEGRRTRTLFVSKPPPLPAPAGKAKEEGRKATSSAGEAE